MSRPSWKAAASGYLSVRTKPSAEVAEAEALYARADEEKQAQASFRRAARCRLGLMGWWDGARMWAWWRAWPGCWPSWP
jgi:hypothetical protein